MNIGRVLLGLIIIGLGVGLVYYSSQIARMFGKWTWAEMYLGGTRQAYILMGFAAMVIGCLVMFGIIEGAGKVQELKINIDG